MRSSVRSAGGQVDIKQISLVCNEETHRARLGADIAAGKRMEDVLARSLARIPLYEKLDTVKISTDGKPIAAIANEVMSLHN